MSQCIASVAVVGAGDYIGSAIVRGSHVRATGLPAGEKGASRRLWSQRSRLPWCLRPLVEPRQQGATTDSMRLA